MSSREDFLNTSSRLRTLSRSSSGGGLHEQWATRKLASRTEAEILSAVLAAAEPTLSVTYFPTPNALAHEAFSSSRTPGALDVGNAGASIGVVTQEAITSPGEGTKYVENLSSSQGHLRWRAQNVVSVDLVAASYRSTGFPQDWTREKRETEAARYEQFLVLAAKHPGKRATPTREIDEFWHLHMLHPVAYHEDCQRLFGRVFDHDGGFGTGPGELPVLKTAFREFAARWQDEYGAPYVGEMPGDEGGATSCWHDCSNRCWHACSS